MSRSRKGSAEKKKELFPFSHIPPFIKWLVRLDVSMRLLWSAQKHKVLECKQTRADREEKRKLVSVSPNVILLCLVLLLAATVLLPSGAAGMEDWESSDSGQELLPVLFHAMRFTSCGGTETHNGWSTNRNNMVEWEQDALVIIPTQTCTHTPHAVKAGQDTTDCCGVFSTC